jgi:DNA adenine methylase
MELIRAPFPWFGGKARVASLIWDRLGWDIGTYVEPFAGSCAVALNRPDKFKGWITLNDIDGNISNFWRAMEQAPEEVAIHASSPVNECDLHARHLWLVNNAQKLTSRLMADPDYFEPKTAGWWAWGLCLWIGHGWCSGQGGWMAQEDEEGISALVALGNGGRGVARQLLHLGDGGQGVAKKLPHLGDGGKEAQRLEFLNTWFAKLSDLLYDSRTCCGSWERVLSVGTMTRNGIAGILLDPPYSLTDAVYTHDSKSISGEVREWALANGENPLLRIALCGHTAEGHEILESHGWKVAKWNSSGYQGGDDRERIWFSPHCISPEMGGLFQDV